MSIRKMKTKIHDPNITVPERRFPHAFSAPSHLAEAHLRKFLTTLRSRDHPNEGTDELKRFQNRFQ